MVSVLCTAYNHEKYIRECLDGLVMQKTSFKYEVLINDDASKDHTADIIREYELRYPVIRAIYQKENQHSKNIPITSGILLPQARGKYISFCEGDDCWIDPYKLQKQFDAMEANPQICVCLHKVRVIQEDGTITNTFRPIIDLPTGILFQEHFSKLLVYPSAYYFMQFQLTSYFIKNESYREYVLRGGALRSHFDVGDLPLLLYMSMISDAYYINDEMSHYRMGSIGSWNSRNNSKEKICQHCLKEAEGLSVFNELTEFKYDSSVRMGILAHKLKCADIQGEMSLTKYRDFFPVIKQMRFRTQIRLLIMSVFPRLIKRIL